MDWLLDIGIAGFVLVLFGVMLFGISLWWLLAPAVPFVAANVMWWCGKHWRRS